MRWWQRPFVAWTRVPGDGAGDGQRSRAFGVVVGYMSEPRHVFLELLLFRGVLVLAIDLGGRPRT